nr:hypothetical protein [uncultured Roseovarius sp.]
MEIAPRIIAVVKAPLRPLRHGAVAITRGILLDRLFSRSDIPHNLVISTGGAGTTFLMKHLSRYVQINDFFDRDNLKHLPHLPEGWVENNRILYVYDEPTAVFRSIKRRKFVHKHAGELGCLACQFTWGRLRQKLFERAVRKQIEAFHAYRSDNVMLLAYDDIWNRLEEVSAFFGIDDDRFVREFPPRRPRKSHHK